MKFSKCNQGLLYVITAVQTVMALIWGAMNMNQIPGYSLANDYLKAAESMHTDGYLGAFYAFLLRLFSDCLGLLYYIQWIFLGAALFFFLGLFLKEIRLRIVTTVYGMTLPFVLQCFFAVWSYAIAVPTLLILIRYLYDYVMSDKKTDERPYKVFYMVKNLIVITMLSTVFVCSGGMYFGWVLIGFVPFIVYGFFKRKQKRIWLSVMMLIMLIIATVNHYVGSKSTYAPEYNRTNPTIETVMLGRFVWPRFVQGYVFWPEEIQKLFPTGQARFIGAYPELVITDFVPPVVETYGQIGSDELFRRMTASVIATWTKDIAKELVTDTLSYGFAPYTIGMNMNWLQESITGINYRIFIHSFDLLFDFYMRFSLGGVYFITLIGAFNLLRKIVYKRKSRMWENASKGIMVCGFFCVYVLWNVFFSIREFDYKNVIMILLMWPILWWVISTRDIERSSKESGSITQNEEI